MEKIQFLLEQEGYELDQLLQETIHSKDEIDAFLRNKVNTKLIASSGAYKILESVVFSRKDNINYDDLMKVVDKKLESEQSSKVSRKKDMIHEITRNIFSKIQLAQQKKLKDSQIFTSEYYRSKFHKIDFDSLTVEKEVQTDNEEDLFHRKSLAVRKMMQNKEIDTYTKDLEAYNEEILRKCHGLELQKNTLENEKGEISMRSKHLQLKLKVKKEKNESLKILVKELREKIEELANKENTSHQMLKVKEREFEKLASKQEENQTLFLNQIKELSSKNDILEKKARELFTSRQTSRYEEKSSASGSPVHHTDYKSAKSLAPSFKKEKKKTSFMDKRKRSSTMDTQLLNRLAEKKSLAAPPAIKKTEKIPEIKNKEVDIMKRSRSVFLINQNKTRESLMKSKNSLQKTSIQLIKEEDPPEKEYSNNENSYNYTFGKKLSLPGNMTLSKSYISSSNTSKNKLETLIEDSPKSSIELNKNPENNENDNKVITNGSIEEVSEEKESLERKLQYPNIKEFDEKPKQQEIAVSTSPINLVSHKEKEASANFVDKVELYLNKLQKMSEQNNIKIRTILSKLFLHRNHQAFLDAMLLFIQKWSTKTCEKFIQTDNTQLNIATLKTMPANAVKPKSQDSSHFLSKTTRFEDFSSNNRPISYGESLEGLNINRDSNKKLQVQRSKTQKSYSQHVFPSNYSRKNENNFEDSLIPNIKKEKPINITSFLFNKAIVNANTNADIFSELNKKNNNVNENHNFYQKSSRNQQELLLKIELDQEKEEDEKEKQQLIFRVSEHIKEIQKNKNENFAKIKHFFKYPFKTVRQIAGNDLEIGLEDGKIEQLVRQFIDKHKICGKNCKHLQRFYRRIGFINYQIEKKEALLHRQLINKLPSLEENK